MNFSFKDQKLKEYFFIIIIFLVSISVNQYYGNIGVYPIDSFLFFDSGFRFLNGQFPFKDVWTFSGPLIDLIQGIFFKLFGISWFTYVLHGSFFNFLISISTYFVLRKFQLEPHFCLFYSLTLALVAYTNSGTPSLDHHSMIFSIIAIFIFILAIKENNNIYWFLIPIFLFFAFLSKQTPAGYIIILISTISFLYFLFNFSYKRIIIVVSSSILCLATLFLFFYLNKIPISSFYDQYILFASSIGKERFSYYLYPIEFSRYILRFKIIHLSQLILIIIVLKNIYKDFNYLKSNEFFILISLIATGLIFIFHQILSLNQKFIFMIIPILIGFSHIFYKKYFINKKIISFFLILLALGSSIYNISAYANNRKFMDLENIDLKKAISAKELDRRLEGLKWISPIYPSNPKLEVSLLKDIIKIMKEDKQKKMLITHYQFISAIIDESTLSPSRTYTTNDISYPTSESKFFNQYKIFFNNLIKKNKVKSIYIIKPLKDEIITDFIDKSCYSKNDINEILTIYKINEC